MNRKYFLSIDIGASSGRHIVGWIDNGEIKTKEVYRFSNGVKSFDGHLIWDIDYLESEVRKGIDLALSEYKVESFSIDTWGVDYVLLKGDEVVYPVYSYRDDRTDSVIDEVHKIISFEDLYKTTGIQYQKFNSIYQLFDDKKKNRLKGITDFLMIPEYLMYRLTGVKKKEYTNATTTGLINTDTLSFDSKIVSSLGLPSHLFTPLSMPKEDCGEYKGIKCILSPTHDTASAVEGMKLSNDSLYISSGTWSLLGAKVKKAMKDEKSMKCNYSNEGGVNYIRYQKNIMGMWVINNLQKELCPELSFSDIFSSLDDKEVDTVNLDDEIFLSPESMKSVFDQKTNNTLKNNEDYFLSALHSLALNYKRAVEDIEKNTGRKYSEIVISGGGAKNKHLNKLTEIYTNKNVVAFEKEATALGNLKTQMEVYNEL